MTRGSRARKIFVSYSREGGQAHAVSLFQGLTQVLGEKAVFLDVRQDAMEAGRSWKETVESSLTKCDTLLLVFDPSMTVRLTDSESPVLFELEAALKHNITIACVRVDGAVMPISSDLPSSLSNFSEWHSPEIHSDAVMADIERVIKELTGRVPGQVPLVDQWDLVVLTTIAVLGLVAWLSLGDALNSKEKWLWGVSLIIPWLLWMTGRRALSFSNRGRSSLSYRQAASWLVVLAIVAIGWTFAKAKIYLIPKFETDSGILVSRIKGDSNDENQGDLRDSFTISNDHNLPSRVFNLPVRVGFSLLANSANAREGHLEAQRYGIEAKAAVVLWGSQLQGEATETERLEVNLTFVENDGSFKQIIDTELAGTIEASNLTSIDGSLGYFSEMLPRFLKTYNLYRKSSNQQDYENVIKGFTDDIAFLSDKLVEDSVHQSATEEMLAALYFFRGNTYWFQGGNDDDEVETDYIKAIDLTKTSNSSLTYIAASNNLGYYRMKTGHLEEAEATLELLHRHCERKREYLRECSYTAYNLGDTLARLGRLDDASEYFRLAMDKISKTPIEVQNHNLALNSQHYLSYLLVRRASNAKEGEKEQLLKDASREYQKEARIAEDNKLKVPEYYQVLKSRIHIENSEWQDAIDVLLNIEELPDFMLRDKYALLAGAYYCLPDIKQAQKHVVALQLTEFKNLAKDGPSITIKQGEIEIKRIEEMCTR